MSHIVAKPFTTVNRRLRVNDPVDPADDFSPHTFADLERRGFIAAAPAPKPAKPRGQAPE